jgi:hypothetical protein
MENQENTIDAIRNRIIEKIYRIDDIKMLRKIGAMIDEIIRKEKEKQNKEIK